MLLRNIGATDHTDKHGSVRIDALLYFSCPFVAIRGPRICRRQIYPCSSVLSVSCIPVFFRALSCSFVAPTFAAGKFIRAYPCYPCPVFLYSFVPFRVHSWPPHLSQSKKNPASAGLNKFRRLFLRQFDTGFLLHQSIIGKCYHRYKNQCGHYRIFKERQSRFIAKHQAAECFRIHGFSACTTPYDQV